MSCKIYRIVDNTNGNVYVGSTKLDLERRISLHISNNKNPNNSNCSSDIIIQNNDYFYEIIEECDLNNRKERERYYINHTEKCINTIKLNGTNFKANMKKHDAKRNKCPIRIAYMRKSDNDRYYWRNSWGGDKRHNNNLLQIDLDLFK